MWRLPQYPPEDRRRRHFTIDTAKPYPWSTIQHNTDNTVPERTTCANSLGCEQIPNERHPERGAPDEAILVEPVVGRVVVHVLAAQLGRRAEHEEGAGTLIEEERVVLCSKASQQGK